MSQLRDRRRDQAGHLAVGTAVRRVGARGTAEADTQGAEETEAQAQKGKARGGQGPLQRV